MYLGTSHDLLYRKHRRLETPPATRAGEPRRPATYKDAEDDEETEHVRNISPIPIHEGGLRPLCWLRAVRPLLHPFPAPGLVPGER